MFMRGSVLTAMAVAAAAAIACRRPSPLPPLVADVSGTREIAGLSAPVRVVRDRWGVPHIYAETTDDLFAAQGFVQAQDRLFQIDLWRRSALGRLAEVLGPNFAERDAMTRRIQYAGDMDAEWRSYAPDTRAIAAAFVRGVNAWVAIARERPPEEFVLAGWMPEPWAAEDLLTRTDAFAAGSDAIGEVFRARLVAALGARRAAALVPQLSRAPASRSEASTLVGPVVADAIRSVGAPPFFLGLAASPQTPAQPDPSAGARHGDIPLDVKTYAVPSLRYLVHLHAPGWNVIGATAPWMPGVSDGHNDRVWWRMEPAAVDTQDVFVERVNPANAHQVEEAGRWIDTALAREPLAIRRRDKPLVFDRERTRHGAIVAVDRERHLAFTVRAVTDEAGAAGDLLVLDIDRAASVDAIRAVLSRWKAPARRVSYADVTGGRRSDIAAALPVRRGWNGALPAAGWTGANEWIGWQRPETADAPSPIDLLARRHPARADALLRDLRDAADAPNPASAMRAVLVNAIADALAEEGGPRSAVLFSHPLAISEATRRRFDIGPLRPGTPDSPVFALTLDPADWDRSTAMNAPGQAGSPSNVHYADLVGPWREAVPIALAFSDRAVTAAAASTLTLAPARGSAAR
jgi:penicillin amidase